MTSYVVAARMALIDCENGTTVSVMQGGPVPEDVTPDHLEHLLGLGLVKSAKFQGGLAPTLGGDGGDPKEALASSPDVRRASSPDAKAAGKPSS